MKRHKPTMGDFRRDKEAVRKLSPEQFRVTSSARVTLLSRAHRLGTRVVTLRHASYT